MPKFGDTSELQTHKTGNFAFSAAKIENLGASEYTLATIVADRSGSTSGFQNDMENALKEIVKALQLSPRADNLLLRFVSFDNNLLEVHGFKLLQDCQQDDYANTLSPGGSTALFDSTLNGIEATVNYGKQLTDQDFDCNGILFVVTDGCDNCSTFGKPQVKDALAKIVSSEVLESMLSILIGVNITDTYVARELDTFNREAGFSQYVELKDADKSTLAKLAKFVSQSISSQSQALGTGAPSKSLNF